MGDRLKGLLIMALSVLTYLLFALLVAFGENSLVFLLIKAAVLFLLLLVVVVIFFAGFVLYKMPRDSHESPNDPSRQLLSQGSQSEKRS